MGNEPRRVKLHRVGASSIQENFSFESYKIVDLILREITGYSSILLESCHMSDGFVALFILYFASVKLKLQIFLDRTGGMITVKGSGSEMIYLLSL